jgi:hypothetical protein
MEKCVSGREFYVGGGRKEGKKVKALNVGVTLLE